MPGLTKGDPLSSLPVLPREEEKSSGRGKGLCAPAQPTGHSLGLGQKVQPIISLNKYFMPIVHKMLEGTTLVQCTIQQRAMFLFPRGRLVSSASFLQPFLGTQPR